MDKVINLRIPHIGEQIFQSLSTNEIFPCLEVSRTWRVLAANVVLGRNDALLMACKNGHQDVVKILLEHTATANIDFNARDTDGSTPFLVACMYGQTDIVQLLLDYSDKKTIKLYSVDKYGENAFSKACANGHVDTVRLLLESSKIKIFPRQWNVEVNKAWNRGYNHRKIVQVLFQSSPHYSPLMYSLSSKRSNKPFQYGMWNFITDIT